MQEGARTSSVTKMAATRTERPEWVKWKLGLVSFGLGKWGSSHTGTWIWSLGMGEKMLKIKNGNGI